EDVADLQVAAVAGVMCQQLGRSPVKITRVRFAQEKWIKLIVAHGFCCEKNLKFHIEASMLLIGRGMKVRKRFGIRGRMRFSWDAEGFERGHGRNPGRDGGGEIFCEEGPERLVL